MQMLLPLEAMCTDVLTIILLLHVLGSTGIREQIQTWATPAQVYMICYSDPASGNLPREVSSQIYRECFETVTIQHSHPLSFELLIL